MNQHAQFAPVAPIQILEEMAKTDRRHLFGDYHLLLAHHTIQYHDRFHALFDRVFSPHYGDATIIMDNSIVELGDAVTSDMIASAVTTVMLSHRPEIRVIPVLPDVMGNGSATLEKSIEAYYEWDKQQMPGAGYMVVAQGPTYWDFAQVIDNLIIKEGFPKITHVGIPRKMTESEGSRYPCIDYLKAVAPHIKIHLLGFSDDIFDDIRCARLGGVAGIDSAVPVRHDGLLTPSSQTEPRDPLWMQKGELTFFGAQNIKRVRQWLANPL